MKPGDHPEFFRFPAPEGRSRESSIRLDAEGRFWHDEERVEHPGMAKAFGTWIRRHPEDGRFILSNGYDWTYFTVEDVPLFVQGVRVAEGVVWLTLSDGTVEALDPGTLHHGRRSDALYLWVHGGALEARFHPQAQLALAPLLVELAPGQLALRLGERHWRLPGA